MWTVKLGGDKTVSLDDISPEVFDRIAAEDDDATWWGVYAFPAASSDRLYRVVCAAYEHAGLEPPEKPASMTAAKSLLELLDRQPDIEELPMVDGFPQMPDGPETGSGSGVPGDSDGPQTSSDDNE